MHLTPHILKVFRGHQLRLSVNQLVHRWVSGKVRHALYKLRRELHRQGCAIVVTSFLSFAQDDPFVATKLDGVDVSVAIIQLLREIDQPHDSPGHVRQSGSVVHLEAV